MSTLAEQRGAIVAQLAAIPEIGLVHDRERFAKDQAKFAELFLAEIGGAKQIRGWWLRRVATSEKAVTNGTSLTEHTWQWRCYMAFNDQAESELALDALIEAYRDAHRADPTVGGVCELNPLAGGDGTDGVQVIDAGPVTFCGALCHSAVLQLRTWSYV